MIKYGQAKPREIPDSKLRFMRGEYVRLSVLRTQNGKVEKGKETRKEMEKMHKHEPLTIYLDSSMHMLLKFACQLPS